MRNSNAFLPEEDDYIREHIKEQSYQDMADNINRLFGTHRTRRTIAQHCHRVLHIVRGLNYSPEEDAYLRENVKTQTHKELAENLARLFGVYRSEQSVRSRLNNYLNLHRDEFYYTDEELQFVRDNGNSMSLPELHKAYCERFDKKRSVHAIYDIGRKIGVKRTADTIKRIYAETGAKNAAEDGQEHECDGYVRVKKKGMKHWQLRSRVVWEEHHGKIPKDHIIVHLDGDGMNDNIDNLACVPRRYMALSARALGGIKSPSREVNEAKIKYCELKDALAGRTDEKD